MGGFWSFIATAANGKVRRFRSFAGPRCAAHCDAAEPRRQEYEANVSHDGNACFVCMSGESGLRVQISRIRSLSLRSPQTPMSVSILLPLAVLFAVASSAAAQEATYRLSIKDHKFQPSELEIPASQKIALVVKNEDPTPEEFESIQLRREKVIPGGQETTVYIGPLKPGRYEFFGDFNPKTARGYIVVK
jgi:hypothetical protein